MKFILFVGGILLICVASMVLPILYSDLFYRIDDLVDRGYVIEKSDDDSGTGEAKPIDIVTLVQAGDPKRGKRVANKCKSCHTFNSQQGHKIGPNLWGVVDSDVASKEDFAYSKAIMNKDGVWDVESLYHFIKKPNKYIKGTKMAFIGLKKDRDLADVIAFLKTKK